MTIVDHPGAIVSITDDHECANLRAALLFRQANTRLPTVTSSLEVERLFCAAHSMVSVVELRHTRATTCQALMTAHQMVCLLQY